jgi:2-dehydro-3-deoxyphosphooctonate aldolase (KDO 8-P synthase)
MSYKTLSETLTFICGPCVIEDETQTVETAHQLSEIFSKLSLPWVFKSSYDKANRSAGDSFRGPGLEKGLKILERIKREVGVMVTADIHHPEEAAIAAEVLDILQIPPFLCRQTDLILAAASTGKIVNVKKGQFCAPWDMKNVVEKIVSCGNDQIILTDRGVSFGYNNLTSDMRAIPVMKGFGALVCFDATHSAMLPGGHGNKSAGQREFIPTLAKAAVAAGADLIFIEAHQDPKQAKSDSDTQLALGELEPLLMQLKKIHAAL